MNPRKLNPSERLHQCPFPLIGLTGGIATGKSTVSEILTKKEVHVICADRLIHQIYSEESVLSFLSNRVPEALQKGEIQFPKLREAFFKDKKLKADLEKLLYSYLPRYFTDSLPKTAKFVVYDVPLLFEVGMGSKFDLIVSVLCSKETQRMRVLKRDPEMTEETLGQVLSNQISLNDKRAKSDIVIENDGTLEDLEDKVKELLSELNNLW